MYVCLRGLLRNPKAVVWKAVTNVVGEEKTKAIPPNAPAGMHDNVVLVGGNRSRIR